MAHRRQPADRRHLSHLTLAQTIRRVLAWQVALALSLIVLIVLATALLSGAQALPTLGVARAQAAAFGALLGMAATVATARSVVLSARAARENPHLGLAPVYFGLLLKLLIVAGGAFLGLVYWQLGPLYVALGYLIMQAGYAGAALDTNGARKRRKHQSS